MIGFWHNIIIQGLFVSLADFSNLFVNVLPKRLLGSKGIGGIFESSLGVLIAGVCENDWWPLWFCSREHSVVNCRLDLWYKHVSKVFVILEHISVG